MNNPLISVIIPCYNHGAFVSEAVNSVIVNSKKYAVEIIIVNDGSTDAQTLETLDQLPKQNITVLNQDNQGLAKARNNGIRASKGEFILPLDSDNRLTSSYLNDAIDLFRKDATIDIIYGDAERFGIENNLWKNKAIDKRQMLFENHIDACAIFRRSVFDQVSGYSEDMPYMGCEDWNFWLKCLVAKKNFYYLPQICFEYRVLNNSMIRSVTEGFQKKILCYNFLNMTELYLEQMKEDHLILTNFFSGSTLSRITKTVLERLNLYTFKK